MTRKIKDWKEEYDAGLAAVGSCDYPSAQGHMEAALQVLESTETSSEQDIMLVLEQLGHVLWLRKRLGEAYRVFERLLGLEEETSGSENLGVALAIQYLAEVSIEQEEYDRATTLLRRVIAILEPRLDRLRVGYAQAMDSLAYCERMQGKFLHALEHLRAAISALEASEGLESSSAIPVLWHLAHTFDAADLSRRQKSARERTTALRAAVQDALSDLEPTSEANEDE